MSPAERFWLVLDRVAIIAVLAASTAVIWKSTVASAVAEPVVRTADLASAPGSNIPAVEVIDELIATDVVRVAASIGASTSKLVIVEFADYQCPFCARSIPKACMPN
jgi:protein-disulfide isomerase